MSSVLDRRLAKADAKEVLSMEADVARGVQFLDARFPGWRARVNSRALDVSNGGLCALAQATGTGSYSDAKMKLKMSDVQLGNLGFWLPPGQMDRYPALTALWAKAIRETEAA